jgi:hypothetical protein
MSNRQTKWFVVTLCAVLAGCGVAGFAQLTQSSLDNGTIRVGINTNVYGGAITYLSLSGTNRNLINNYDRGRQVQQSYYAGQDVDRLAEGQHSSWSPWPWNPIQAGDAYDNSSSVLEHSNDGEEIYVKTRPLLWDMNNVFAQCHFETWIRLAGNHVRVRNRLTSFRTDEVWDERPRHQELPAVYTIADLSHLYTYHGRRPFTGEAAVQIVTNGLPSGPPWKYWGQTRPTEKWAAFVDNDSWGVGVYYKDTELFVGGFAGTPGGGPADFSTGYISPLRTMALGKNSVFEYEYVLLVGTLDEIRSQVYEMEGYVSVPHRQDFEEMEEGALPAGSGWITTSDVSIISRDYIYDGEFPLPDSTRQRVLNIGTNGSAATIRFDPLREASGLYLDVMICFTLPDGAPAEPIESDDMKLGVFMNPQGHLVLFHGGPAGESGLWTVLDGRFTPGTWRRVTVRMDMAAVGESDPVPFFQFLVDGEIQSGTDGHGFSEPSLDPGGYAGGSWFRFANYTSQAAAGTHRTIREAGFCSIGMIDDFVLTDREPSLPARKTYVIRSLPGPGGTADPAGDVLVRSGDYFTVTYRADLFYKITELLSDGNPVPEASGAEQYAWSRFNITAHGSNQVIFTEKIWDGDGRSPLWWADARGYTDGVSLTVHEGYLLNQDDLNSPFELIGIDLNEEGKLFVKWRSSGPARGNVSAVFLSDLRTPGLWPEMEGETVHQMGTNTWTASGASGTNGFFRILIRNES